MGEHPDLTTAGPIATSWKRIDDYLTAWLVSIRNPKTRTTYAEGAKQWIQFCMDRGFDPLTAIRPHLELWLLHLEQLGRKPRTIINRLGAVRSLYQYLYAEELIAKDPTARVPRPKVPRVSPTGFLRNGQLLDLVNASRAFGAHPHALVCLLAFNGLRINEACSLNIADLTYREAYPIVVVHRKGGDTQWVEIARTTENAVQAAIETRLKGASAEPDAPLLLTRYGTRMNQHCAQRILERARPFVRGEPAHIHPHMIRHSWCTEAVRNGVPMDQIVRDGGWTDSRMAVSIYNHAGEQPGRGAAHRMESAVLSG